MKIKSPFAKIEQHEAGTLVLTQTGAGLVLGLMSVWPEEDLGIVLLEGSDTGKVIWDFNQAKLKFIEQTVLELPRNSSGWLGHELPQRPLVAATDGGDYYFIIRSQDGKPYEVNVITGEVQLHKRRGAFYLNKWEIWAEEPRQLVCAGE